MVQMYTIAGRQVGSHYLAAGVLGSLFGGVYLSLRGPSSASAPATPPINASSSDEADFIKKFMESADKDAKQEAKH